jgi:hypothetical protein
MGEDQLVPPIPMCRWIRRGYRRHGGAKISTAEPTRGAAKQIRFILMDDGKCLCVSRDTRREQNQKVFRMGNERFRDAVDEQEMIPETARVPFLCECADEFCNGRVELERTQWESIASNPNEYVMLAGHMRSEGEVVVGEFDGYNIVRKPD